MDILGNRSRDGLMAEMLYALLDQPSGSVPWPMTFRQFSSRRRRVFEDQTKKHLMFFSLTIGARGLRH